MHTRGGRRERWIWIVALLFVTLTMAVLIATPLFVQRRVNQYRADIEASEPARTLLMGLQFNLVREMSSLNQYAVKPQPARAAIFRQARDNERRIWSELAPLATQLGPLVHERFVQARTLAEFWHEQLHEDELLRRTADGLAIMQSQEVEQRFEQVLLATHQLDSLIIRTTEAARVNIGAAERSGVILTLVSGALAFLAAGVVGLLVLRIRKLAVEADRGRRELAKALAESAREAAARTRLLRGITHDVKNPLGAARGYAELLDMGLKGPLNPDQEKLVDGVRRSIDSSLAIISDLLDLARVDAGSITVHRMNVDLNDVARQAAEDHRGMAETAGHKIVLERTEGALEVYTDPVRVRQVLDNLLTNAIKYTPAPGVIVIRTDANPGDKPFEKRGVAIRVSDTGPGIPADQRDMIFDEFTRLDDNSKMKGHGLGLAIARRVARLLGGELDLVETDAPGATFVLWLPRREQREYPRPDRPAQFKSRSGVEPLLDGDSRVNARESS